MPPKSTPHGDPRRLRSPRFSPLDFKVGLRMLARYPGLTIVGTVALAVAVALGALYFETIDKFQNPRLPVAEASRVVALREWDANKFTEERRLLHDFAIWRERVRTVEHLGAAIPFVRNLTTEDGLIEPVRGADVTADAFVVMQTQPLIGRALRAADGDPSEPLVVVIGERVWRNRFQSDPQILGRPVKVGGADATIVGVMPEGFAFPMSQRLWMPLRVEGSTLSPRTGPEVTVFGVLAPGVSVDAARAELNTIGGALASASPETHRDLRPHVTAFGKPLAEGGDALVIRNVAYGANVIFLLLLGVIAVNVATLVFARTATRGWEITVRTALGATRRRILMQLFIEALVLVSVAAIVGLLVAKLVLWQGVSLLSATDGMPFWIDDGLSVKTVLYTAMLALFGASIIGILPSLRLTRGNVQDALRSEGAARSGLRFGGFWTAVIVVQVAITVAFLPLAAGGVFESNRFQQRAEGIDADRYLTAQVALDPEDHGADSAAFAVRARSSLRELAERLGAEPGVEGVAFADRLPVMDQFKYDIEVDTATGAPATGLRTSTVVQVSEGFLPAFGASVVAGRDFEPLDFETGNALLVNRSFARYVFGERNAIGQRIRIVRGEDGSITGDESYEIVGMVEDFGRQLPRPHEQSAIYRPTLPSRIPNVNLAVRTRDTEGLATRLRTLAAEVDPTIRLTDVQPLGQVGGGEATINWVLTSVAWLISAIVLLLSATGIHALMSFTVTRRTREIGIRTALGAGRGRIISGIFMRAAMQIGAGVVIGSGLALLVGAGSDHGAMLLLAANIVMLLVGLTACALPVLRAMRIDPMNALRAEG